MRTADMAGRLTPAPINTLPDIFRGVVMDEQTKADSFGADCLYLVIAANIDGITKKVTQKFRESQQVEILAPALQDLGIDDTGDLIGTEYDWVKKESEFAGGILSNGNVTYPRYIPIPVLDTDDIPVKGKKSKTAK